MEYIVEEIGREFFLIRSPEMELNRNIYLKRFISSDRKERVFLKIAKNENSNYL
jgi:hypothetical protein